MQVKRPGDQDQWFIEVGRPNLLLRDRTPGKAVIDFGVSEYPLRESMTLYGILAVDDEGISIGLPRAPTGSPVAVNNGDLNHLS
jgi:hypothetical protein